ncbi:MAG TPA: DeoR/GlpR family DNA-binding transcription regulator [Burkholderiaceae bacterium]|jgi:DeoR/GlpR family transcriptional regulator of sugar metabolism
MKTPRRAVRPRFAEERQSAIERRLRETGRVEVAALAAEYRVSEDSIRRDLRGLAERGLVHKTHGGAIALQPSAMPMAQRGDVKAEVKRAIGRRAAARVQPHQTLFIDSGTTALALAQALAAPEAPRPLTVITTAIDVALLLGSDARVRLVLAGGEWSPETRAFSGPQAEAELRAHRADWAFLGACALHPRLGLSASLAGDASMKRAMLECALQRVLLADASKFDAVQPQRVAGLDQLDVVITDAAPAWLRTRVKTVERVAVAQPR